MLPHDPTKLPVSTTSTPPIQPLPSQIRTIGRTQFYTDGTNPYKRRTGTNDPWRLISTSPLADDTRPPPIQLSLVLESQAPGESHHWSFYLAREDISIPGDVYAVTGDAECMILKVERGFDILGSADFSACYVLAGDFGEDCSRVLEEVVAAERPPQARWWKIVRGGVLE